MHFINGCLGALCKPIAESFLHCYSPGDRSGDEALAALAGRGLAGPGRDRIITGALSRHYGVTSGFEFFSLLGEEEAKHSRAMWRAIIRDRRADTERLVEAARLYETGQFRVPVQEAFPFAEAAAAHALAESGPRQGKIVLTAPNA